MMWTALWSLVRSSAEKSKSKTKPSSSSRRHCHSMMFFQRPTWPWAESTTNSKMMNLLLSNSKLPSNSHWIHNSKKSICSHISTLAANTKERRRSSKQSIISNRFFCMINRTLELPFILPHSWQTLETLKRLRSISNIAANWRPRVFLLTLDWAKFCINLRSSQMLLSNLKW